MLMKNLILRLNGRIIVTSTKFVSIVTSSVVIFASTDSGITHIVLSNIIIIIITNISSSAVSEAECDEFDVETFDVVEGDALHFMPYLLRDPDFRAWATDGQFIWCKRNLTDECILSEEEERIHYHGGVLFIFNLSSEDCGHYICR